MSELPSPASSGAPRTGAGLSVPLAFVVLLILLAKCLAKTDGNLPYSLDDAFIHLQLARNIASGSYGINPGEWAAPSSSILWPLLLAPFARTSFAIAVPLVYNFCAMLVSVWWMEELFRQYLPPRAAVILALAFAWSINLFGLPFTGMEHSLQVMLVIILVTHLAGRTVPRTLVCACILLLPWVRYESLAISLPAAVYLWKTETSRTGRAWIAASLGSSLLGLVVFSLMLHAHGLGWLPSSVMLKQGLMRAGLGVKLVDMFAQLGDNLEKLRVLVVLIATVSLTPSVRRGAPHLVGLLLASSALLFALGRTSGRYEVHFLAFSLLLIASLVLPHWRSFSERVRVWPLALVLLLVSPELWMLTLGTPLGARCVYEQQYQMGSIVRDFLKQPVAVNDLGLVSWLGQQPVLDLWGLGSHQTLLLRTSDPSGRWIEASVRDHGVQYLFIYTQWLPHLPEAWRHVGRLTLLSPRVAVAFDNVEMFATNPAAAARLAGALHAYRQTSALAAKSVSIFAQPVAAEAATSRR